MHRVLLAAAGAAALLGAGLGDAAAQQTPLSRRACPASRTSPPAGPARAAACVPPEEAPPPPSRARRTTPPAVVAPPLESAALGRDLDAALGIDAGARAILGQREAVRSREAQVRSPIAGSPAIGPSFRSDTRGPRTGHEWDVELGAPMWLPGQRGALAGTEMAGIEEQERRLTLRRLELAGLLRDAYWAVGLAASELGVARDPLATAPRHRPRRAAPGGAGRHRETEALLTRNEELAAALSSPAPRRRWRPRAPPTAPTGGSEAALTAGRRGGPPRRARRGDGAGHPAVRAAAAALATAEARARLVAATQIDNPELACSPAARRAGDGERHFGRPAGPHPAADRGAQRPPPRRRRGSAPGRRAS